MDQQRQTIGVSFYVRQLPLFFYRIGKFVQYDKNPPGGLHCGGRVGCRRGDPPQAENPASGILSYAVSKKED